MPAEDRSCCTSDETMLSDVLDGLGTQPKSLPCKYLYDARGSQLFDKICDLEEYYLTRTESSIMVDNAKDIASSLGEQILLVEFGSGSSIKTRVLLENLVSPVAYLPVDISEEHLLSTADQLEKDYPDLTVHPVVGDFTQEIEIPDIYDLEKTFVYFPGSTIGNFEHTEASELLAKIRHLCGPEGGLLVGFDLKKETQVLEVAYNDPQGVTASFSLNILRRLNRELDANFDLAAYKHLSYFNENEGRIEIFIESLADQTVRICNEEIVLAEGERIHTEYSHKYSIDGFADLAEDAGLKLDHVWTDSRDYFAVMLLRVQH